ncbi:hypothetical protein B5807_06631 [Epicoccum nigrum]|uniref:Uncharacterized protein n=1 Tax=Epicoccum nigrum TaxID=105696 RepID=A0A1Y2LW57_EPING|nr:hypothetical protein B5807_06631 [Epicoccum nigrum]
MDMNSVSWSSANEFKNPENEPGSAFPSFDSTSAEPPDSPIYERRPEPQLGNPVIEDGEHSPSGIASVASSAHSNDTVVTNANHVVMNTNSVQQNWQEMREKSVGGLQNGQVPPLDTPMATEHDLQQELQEQEEQAANDVSLPPLDNHLQTLYTAYQTSYALPITPTSAHMQHAKALASALLHRHFPASSGYRVDPIPLGPYSAPGINFMLKEDHERDSDPDTPPPKMITRLARKTHIQYSFESSWHHIEPASMAAFEVKKALPGEDGGAGPLKYRTHTALIIVLDDLATFHRWSRANINHRGDVLTDVLGVRGGMEKGRGMLFFGPRLEMYEYDADDAMLPIKPAAERNWRLDMRVARLAEVDMQLGQFVGGDGGVVYQAK